MKKTLLLTFGLFVASSTFAQLQNYTNAPDFVLETIAGDTFNLYKTLDSGKTVIIDVMATWCPPCWSWHEGEYFKNLYSAYGPEGTDELRMIMVEADSRTPENLLYVTANGGSAGTTSLGDWVTGTTYPIINDDNFNSLYDIAFFPTIYAVTPNRMVYEIGRYTDVSEYQNWHLNTPGVASNDADGIILEYTGQTNVCGSSVDATFQFQNHSLTTASEDFDVSVMSDGNIVAQTTITQDLAPYEIISINAGSLPAALTDGRESDITVMASLANDINQDNSQVDLTIGSPSAVSDSLTLNFTTDFYPVETSWTLRDGDGNIVLSENYSGVAAGGGANANRTFTYGFRPESTDLSCYSLLILDSFGDGLFRTTSTQPIPGFQLLTENNEEVANVQFGGEVNNSFEDDYQSPFGIAAETVVSTSTPIANGINAYPNPVQAGGAVVISLDQLNTTGNVKARLFNALGQTIQTFASRSANSQMTFELPEGVSGVHFLELSAEEGSSVIRLSVQ